MSFLTEYLASPVYEGERNLSLFRAIKAARDAGWDEGRIDKEICGKAIDVDGLGHEEVEKAFTSAMRGDINPPKPVSTMLSDYWVQPVGIIQPMDDAVDDWDSADAIKFLSALYNTEDYVGYNTASVSDGNGKSRPQTNGTYNFTAGELIKQWKGKSTGDAIKANKDCGVWCRLNPLDGKGAADANVTEYKHVLVESDDTPLSEQWRIMNELKIPCATVVFSGGKSLHFAVRIDAGNNENLYKERVKELYELLTNKGFVPDRANKNSSRLSRLPGVWRGDKKQYLVATNIGKSSWDDWILHKNEPEEANVNEWLDKPAPAQSWVFENTVPLGTIVGMYSRGGLGKGWLTQEAAVSLATGVTLLNEFKPVSPMKVVWIESEDPGEELHRRMKAIIEHFSDELDEQHLDRLRANLRVFPGQAFRLAEGDLVEPTPLYTWLQRLIDTWHPKLIVIDPLAHFCGCDENNNVQMSAYINHLKALCRSSNGGCTVWVNHHVSKMREADMDSAAGRGATAIRDSMRAVFQLVPPTEDECDKRPMNRSEWVKFDVTKSNYSAQTDKISWLRRSKKGVLYDDNAPEEKPKDSESKARHLVDLIGVNMEGVTQQDIRYGKPNAVHITNGMVNMFGDRWGSSRVANLLNISFKNGWLEDNENGLTKR